MENFLYKIFYIQNHVFQIYTSNDLLIVEFKVKIQYVKFVTFNKYILHHFIINCIVKPAYHRSIILNSINDYVGILINYKYLINDNTYKMFLLSKYSLDNFCKLYISDYYNWSCYGHI